MYSSIRMISNIHNTRPLLNPINGSDVSGSSSMSGTKMIRLKINPEIIIIKFCLLLLSLKL